MRHDSTVYTVGFAAGICVVCSILVSSSATILKERQKANALLDKQKKVLAVSELTQPGERIGREEVQQLFDDRIEIKIVKLETGEYDPDGVADPVTYDQIKALSDDTMSHAIEKNRALVRRVPTYATVYHVMSKTNELDLIVLPVEGKGLWSTLYGFLALDKDCTTVRGITFYSHGETPGLGGEVDNKTWKGRWKGRKAFDEDWKPVIKVIKGPADPPGEAPHEVDGLSGATLTSNGVTHLVQFWLGDEGFGPYLAKFRADRSDA